MDAKLKEYYSDKLQQIFLYITDKCSFGCKHCLIGDRNNHFFTLNENQVILETIKRSGGTKVTLLGGEPTEHPELMQIVALAKSMDFEVVLDTCGSFSPAFFDDEDFRKIDMICFSVDGHNAQIHDSIRKSGSFEQIMGQIERTRQIGTKIKFTHTVSEINLEFVLAMVSFAADMGIDELNFHVATYNGRAKHNKDARIVAPEAWHQAYHAIRNYVASKTITETKLRIPPRYCTHLELEQLYADHQCIGCLKDRMLILPKDGSKGEIGGPLYACGLLIGERSTLGWNIDDEFVFNDSNEGEFAKYYAKDIPVVKGTPICPIVSKDSGNMNFLENESLIPLCISYKPPLQ